MLELQNISKKIGGFSLNDISLRVESGSYVAILGVSGAGKTMLLETIAGLRKPDSGKILLDNADITRWKPGRRNVGLVFQDNTVFPHLTVMKNIAYSLTGKGLSRAKVRETVFRWAEVASIAHLLDRKPGGLSGGEVKRVALARTLAMEPRILLLDEPFASLDVLLHNEMLQLLQRINLLGQTVIHVTHDFNEAYALADTLIVLSSGKIVQTATPEELYNKPGSRFIAALMGLNNYFSYTCSNDDSEAETIVLDNGLKLFTGKVCSHPGHMYVRDKEIEILSSGTTARQNVIAGKTTGFIASPRHFTIIVDAGLIFFIRVERDSFKKFMLKTGDPITFHIPPPSIRFF